MTKLAQKVSNIDLDQRVGQRTRELAQANLDLEKKAQELADANQLLQGLDKLKSKFVSDVSHELLTPINNLSIYLEMLEEGNPNRADHYKKVLREETDRLEKLVSNMLDLSRMENQTMALVLKTESIDAIIKQVIRANELRADAKGLALKYQPKTSFPTVLVSRDQLIQAISNLVDNAVNYTETGEILITTSLNDTQDQILIEISDTGMGVYQEDAEHIFERFYRGRQTSQSSLPGTGLGLAITKEIIEGHGGRITFRSRIEQGSIFTIYLPLNLAGTEQKRASF